MFYFYWNVRRKRSLIKISFMYSSLNPSFAIPLTSSNQCGYLIFKAGIKLIFKNDTNWWGNYTIMVKAVSKCAVYLKMLRPVLQSNCDGQSISGLLWSFSPVDELPQSWNCCLTEVPSAFSELWSARSDVVVYCTLRHTFVALNLLYLGLKGVTGLDNGSKRISRSQSYPVSNYCSQCFMS